MNLNLSKFIEREKYEFNISRKFTYFLLIIPVIITVISYYLFINDFSFYYKYFVSEKYLVESLSLYIFIINGILSSYFSYVLWIKFKNRKITFFFILLTIGCFFVSFEEISWGQWLFFFKTPEAIKEINIQKEFNFHNIKSVFILSEILKPIFGLLGILLIFNTYGNKMIKSFKVPFSLNTFLIAIIFFSIANFYNFTNNQFVANVMKSNYFESGLFGFAFCYTEVIELFIGFSLLYYLWHCIKRNN